MADLERSLAFYTAVGYEVIGTVPETAFGSLTGYGEAMGCFAAMTTRTAA